MRRGCRQLGELTLQLLELLVLGYRVKQQARETRLNHEEVVLVLTRPIYHSLAHETLSSVVVFRQGKLTIHRDARRLSHEELARFRFPFRSRPSSSSSSAHRWAGCLETY